MMMRYYPGMLTLEHQNAAVLRIATAVTGFALAAVIKHSGQRQAVEISKTLRTMILDQAASAYRYSVMLKRTRAGKANDNRKKK